MIAGFLKHQRYECLYLHLSSLTLVVVYVFVFTGSWSDNSFLLSTPLSFIDAHLLGANPAKASKWSQYANLKNHGNSWYNGPSQYQQELYNSVSFDQTMINSPVSPLVFICRCKISYSASETQRFNLRLNPATDFFHSPTVFFWRQKLNTKRSILSYQMVGSCRWVGTCEPRRKPVLLSIILVV